MSTCDPFAVLSSIGFFFAFVVIWRRRVARLIQPKIGRDDGGHFQFHGLRAAVDFTRDHQRVAVASASIQERALQPAQQSREHPAPDLIAIIVNGLLAENDEPGLFSVTMALRIFALHRQLCAAPSVSTQDTAVGTHQRVSPDRFTGICGWIDAAMISVAFSGFARPDRLFDSNFVERIHRHFDVTELDAGTVCLDADLHAITCRPATSRAHENFHDRNLVASSLDGFFSAPFFQRSPTPGSATMLRCRNLVATSLSVNFVAFGQLQ